MPKHQTLLRCSHRTAALFLSTIIILFVLVGCAALLRSAGLSADQAADQEARLKAALADAVTDAVADVQTGLGEGHDLEALALKTASEFLWKIVAASASTAGVVLSGLLAKWLGTERKINKVLITSIESAKDLDVKATVKTKATAAGIEPKLAARVRALT